MVVESPFGFNARLGTAVAAAAIIGVLTVLSLRHRSPATNVGASMAPSDTHAQAAGDVSPQRATLDCRKGLPRRGRSPRSRRQPIPRTDWTAARAGHRPPPTSARVSSAAIERNDRDMNAVYTKLIGALRRQSSAAAVDPDPETVTKLRRSQRKWSDDRDLVCRKVGTGPLYARERASCFAQQSADRARELQTMLDGFRPAVSRTADEKRESRSSAREFTLRSDASSHQDDTGISASAR